MPIVRSVSRRDRRVAVAGLAALTLLLGACTIPTDDDPADSAVVVDESVTETEPAREQPTADRPLVGRTVFLDPAHGEPVGMDPAATVDDGRGGTAACATAPSATAGGYSEQDFTYETAQILAGHLRELGATVVLAREDAATGPCLDARAAAAAEAGADLAVVLHADAGPEFGYGFHVAFSDPPLVDEQTAGLDAAWTVRDALADRQLVPSTYTGDDGVLSTAEIAELNLSRVPTVLVQLANPANTIEGALLPDPTVRSGYARALRDGIVAYLTALPADPSPAPAGAADAPPAAD